MIEQEIESAFIAKIQSLGIAGLKVLATWTPAADGDLNGILEEPYDVLAFIRVNPRSYDAFTIPQCEMGLELEVSTPLESDPRGTKRLAAVEKIQGLLDAWQSGLSSVVSAFSSSHFTPTGFRLSGGVCGMNRDRSEWTWSQSATIQGVIS